MSDEWELPKINDEKCTGCGDCVVVCPHGVLVMRGHKPAFGRPEQCDYCALCEQTCPNGAVRCDFEIVWEEPSRNDWQHSSNQGEKT